MRERVNDYLIILRRYVHRSHRRLDKQFTTQFMTQAIATTVE